MSANQANLLSLGRRKLLLRIKDDCHQGQSSLARSADESVTLEVAWSGELLPSCLGKLLLFKKGQYWLAGDTTTSIDLLDSILVKVCKLRLADLWSAEQVYLLAKDGLLQLDLGKKWPEPIFGDLLDAETRCLHYHSTKDIIALKCFTCRRYYPCYQCHATYETHAYEPYPSWLGDEVVFCGACQTGLTIAAYRQGDGFCSNCSAAFNPGCKLHEHIYFRD